MGRGLKNFIFIKDFKISFLVVETSSFRHVSRRFENLFVEQSYLEVDCFWTKKRNKKHSEYVFLDHERAVVRKDFWAIDMKQFGTILAGRKLLFFLSQIILCLFRETMNSIHLRLAISFL